MKETDLNILYKEVQKFSQTWVIYLFFAIALILTVIVIINGIIYSYETNDTVISITVSLFVFIFFLLLIFIVKLEVILDKDRILYRFFPINIQYKHILYSQIKSYAIRKYSPILEYGGWGIRYAFTRGWAYNVSGNKGIQIVTTEGKKILFGTRRPEEFFHILDTKNQNNLGLSNVH